MHEKVAELIEQCGGCSQANNPTVTHCENKCEVGKKICALIRKDGYSV